MSNFQSHGFISLLYSVGEKPLDLWSKYVSLDGKIQRIKDDTLNGDKVIEITGPLETGIPTNISCPANLIDVLNIKLPILVLLIRNLDQRKFKLEFQLLDKEQYRRKISLITYDYEKLPMINTNTACVPLILEENWNLLEINLQALCQNIYKTDYQTLQRLIIYPNCRVRRVYLLDRHYGYDEIPIQMCQAFFDMYILKSGIHRIEKECQTENEFYQEPRIEEAFEHFDDSHNLTTRISTCASIVTRKNYKSLNGINIKLIAHSDQKILTCQKQCFLSVTNFSMKKPLDNNEYKNVGNDTLGDETGRITKESQADNSVSFIDVKQTNAVVSESLPIFIETAARTYKTKSRNAILKTGNAISDILSDEVRHSMNKKVLGKFENNSFIMTEVELSRYNCKNRKNNDVQRKLIRSHKQCTSKDTESKPFKTTGIDLSLNKQHLKLDNETCIDIKKKLNTELIKSANRRNVKRFPGNDKNELLNTNSFSSYQMTVIQNKVLHNEEFEHDNVQTFLSQNDKDSSIFIDTEKYSGKHTLNILFEKQTCPNNQCCDIQI